MGRLQHEAIPDSPPFKAHDAGHDAAMAGGLCLHYMKSVIEENNAPDEHDLQNEFPEPKSISVPRAQRYELHKNTERKMARGCH